VVSGIRASFFKRVLAGALAVSFLVAPLQAPQPAEAATSYLTDTAAHPPPTTGTYAYYATYGTFSPGQSGFIGVGNSFVDPIFGNTITRLTNDYPLYSLAEIYAKNGFFNADGTLMHHRSPDANGGRKIINTTTGQVVRANIPGNFDSSFAPDNADVWYWFNWGDTKLMKYSVSTGGSSVVKDFGQTIGQLGGSVDNIDRTGQYIVMHLGSALKVYDLKNDVLYSGDVAESYGGGSGYAGISPDGQYLVANTDGQQHFSFKIDHTNKSVTTSPTLYWTLCGDHGDYLSASNGKTYFVTFECYDQGALYAVDVTLPQSSTNVPQQQTQNKKLLQMPSWNDVAGHFSCVSKGALQDWCYVDVEAGDDLFTSSVSGWRSYEQEVMMVNVITGEIRRLAHHRSRSVRSNYFYTPRVSASWDGSVVAWASNFGDSSGGYVDIYSIRVPTGSGGTTTTTPLAVSFSSPANGATVSGTTTVSMAATGGSGSGYSYALKVDGTSVTASGASYTWDTTRVANGSHTLAVTATDSAGATATSTETVNVQNVAPALAVSFSNPASGATVTGSVTVTVAATGGSGTGYTYTVKAGTTQIYSGTNGSFSWNTTTSTNGTVTLTATATDSAGATGSATRTVTVSNTTTTPPPTTGDTTPPTVAITSPTGNVWTGNSLQISASATDDVKLAKIELWGGGAAFGTIPCTAATCSGKIEWKTGSQPIGALQVNAVAYDAAGNKTVSAPVYLYHNATSPTIASGAGSTSTTTTPALSVAFTSPTSGATVSGTTNFAIAITGASGSSTVAATLDGTSVGSQTVSGSTASISVDTTKVANGSHTVAANVTNGTKTATASIAVNVNNVVVTPPATTDTTPPTVAITSPTGNVWTGNSLQISASATDNVKLAKIELWGGGAAFGTIPCTAATCSGTIEWATGSQPTGALQVNAVAYDAAGNKTVSAPVTLYHNATSPTIASGVGSTSTTTTGGTTGGTTTTGDTTPPTVAFTAPTGNVWTGASLHVAASATDNVQVAKIELWGNGAVFFTQTCSSTSCTADTWWNTGVLATGAYQINAVAYDAAGNRTKSTTLTIYKDATTPLTASGAN
jgi:hypothetical protein